MQKINLTKEILRVLKPALFLAKGTIKREIKKGISHLYITRNNKLYVVLRPENKELVVVAVAGSQLYQSRQEIVNFAINSGFNSIRFHTRKPDLLKKALTGLNIKLIEIRRGLFGSEYVFNLAL